MTTKAQFKRVKESLERERLRLRGEALTLEKRQREMRQERVDAIAYLRLLCGQYGDNDWPDTMPLVEILQVHLAHRLQVDLSRISRRLAQLQAEVERLRQAPEQSQDPLRGATIASDVPDTVRDVPRPTPASGGPAPRDVPGHQTLPVVSTGGKWTGTCSCGWRQFGLPNKEAAQLAGDVHASRMLPLTAT
jgi:predicted secreted protein